MAEESSVAEHIYQAIRDRLLAGLFRYNERLDVGRLAQTYAASTTPVREALTRLASERLIVSRAKRGFFASLWSAEDLRALYAWRGLLLAHAAADKGPVALVLPEPSADHGFSVRGLFRAVEVGANSELRIAAANADDRLHLARAVEATMLDTQADLADLIAGLAMKEAGERQAAIGRYHSARIAVAGELRNRAVLNAVGRDGI